jgi:hypothetical protein
MICNDSFQKMLLEGELSSADEAAAVQHLDECPRCRARLEAAAGSDHDWSEARELLEASAERTHWTPAGLQSLSDTAVHFPGAAEEADLRRPPLVDLSFLAPTDDPAFVGRVGSYEIAGVIGQGGMGVVLKAVDRSLSRHVALKVLSPLLAGAGAARQRFAREARAMAALSHEHVVPIYAVDEHRGLPYFAMEYVPGGTLSARIAHEGPLETIAVVRIAMQTALALAAAHESGLVHRDIKPANILLDRGVERVRVTDFGLARAASEASETASGMLAGTPQYMSPEQINRDSCDARSDLFSLGSMMYAMCTGHAPFRAENVFAVLQRIVHDDPRPVRELNPNVPAWLAAFIARLMAKDRDARFASAAQVAELLAAELAHLQNPASSPLPERAWLPRRSESVRAWLKHRRKAFAAGALSAAVLATFAAAVAWGPWSGNGGATALNAEQQSGGAFAVAGAPPAAAPAVGAPVAVGPGLNLPPVQPPAAAPPGSAAMYPPPPDPPFGAEPFHPSLDPPTVPLWHADGFDVIQQDANALEFGDDGIADGPALDPWPSDVAELEQRLGELSAELLPPPTKRDSE